MWVLVFEVCVGFLVLAAYLKPPLLLARLCFMVEVLEGGRRNANTQKILAIT